MLIQFSVENFLSFKSKASLNMVASSIKRKNDDSVFQANSKLTLLKSAVVYGANASGKSNFFKALGFVRSFILHSSKETQVKERIKVSRYKLSTDTENKPAIFEIIFIHEKITYRYGFAVDEKKVCAEWLFYVPNKKEIRVFTREEQKFNLSVHFKSERLLVEDEKVRPNALLLSVSAQFNGEIAAKMMEWFVNFRGISGVNSGRYAQFTTNLIKIENNKKEVLNFLQDADSGIEGLSVQEKKIAVSDLPKNMPSYFKKFISETVSDNEIVIVNIKTYHHKYNKDGSVVGDVLFDMEYEESGGTKRLFDLSGPLIDVLKNGMILTVDELDVQLHPRLVRAICEIFNSKDRNPHNAQLIFSTHNTNILREDILGRDQVWFVEKNRFGESELYSLVEYKKSDGKKVRKDSSYEKDYLLGKYGAVPCLGTFEVNGEKE